jgi:hypothetical protein
MRPGFKLSGGSAVYCCLAKDLPIDFKPITPGLEIKYAIQEGEKAGAKITFAGREFDS